MITCAFMLKDCKRECQIFTGLKVTRLWQCSAFFSHLSLWPRLRDTWTNLEVQTLTTNRKCIWPFWCSTIPSLGHLLCREFLCPSTRRIYHFILHYNFFFFFEGSGCEEEIDCFQNKIWIQNLINELKFWINHNKSLIFLK